MLNAKHWARMLLVWSAGAILGLYLSRLLAEMSQVSWPFYDWPLAVMMTLLVSSILTLLWQAWLRRFVSAVNYGTITSLISVYLLVFYLAQPSSNLLQAWVLLIGVLTLVLVLSLPHPPAVNYTVAVNDAAVNYAADRWIAALLFVVAITFYLITLSPGVGERDGYELQAISATLGYAHPTGYPLFPILGRLWIALWPFGSIARRINVLCALYAAASVPLVYGLARRVLGRPSFAAWSALAWAFSRTLWTQAAQPEKYTLNVLFVSLILYIAFGATDPQVRGPHPHLHWLAFVYGLSLTHHRTVLMLAPALAVYLLWRDPGLLKRPREWLAALGLALAPLLIYLYIPWRAWAQGGGMSVAEFFRYISGSYYGAAVRLMDWALPERVQMFWRFVQMQFGSAGVVFGVLGLIGLGLRRQWRFLLCTVLAYLAYYVWGTVWYAYYNDVNSFIPNHLLLAVWMGSGAMLIVEWVERIFISIAHKGGHGSLPQAAGTVLWALFALLPMGLIWNNWPQVDASDAWGLTHWGEYAIAQDLAPNATILADREKHPPLDYFARIEGRRSDLDVVILGDEKSYLDRLVWDLAHEKTVYLARFLPGLDGPYHLRSVGPLVEVSTSALLLADIAPAASFKLPGADTSIQLLKHEIQRQSGSPQPHVVAPGDVFYVTLVWYTAAPVTGNYQVNLRLVDANGQVRWSASHHPVSDMYPTASWKSNETIPDWYEIPIDDTLLPGDYQLQVGLFPSFSDEGLEWMPGQVWLSLSQVIVTQSDVSLPKTAARLRVVAPGQWQLLGYDLPDQAPPTGRVPLKLYWEALAWLPDLEIGTRVVDGQGRGEWIWQAPGGGLYPTSQWKSHSTLATTHLLTMPAEKGVATVQVAVRVKNTGQPVVFSPGWLKPKSTMLALPSLTVAGRPPTAAGAFNFNDRILLSSINPGQGTLTPGASLELAVEWQCLQAMDVDYTLFVQLLAPDGTLKGQIDVWPQNGTHPTSQWHEAETVTDRYVVSLREDAPSGEYKVSIGWYLLETMQRLPVLDAEGKAVDDKVLLSGIQVKK